MYFETAHLQATFGAVLVAQGTGLFRVVLSVSRSVGVKNSQCRGLFIQAVAALVLAASTMYINELPITESARPATWFSILAVSVLFLGLGLHQIFRATDSDSRTASIVAALTFAFAAGSLSLMLEILFIIWPGGT